jgi:5-methylcytosine-specific restriction endonuclease McrA
LDINNLQILCHTCNHGKGNWDRTDWRVRIWHMNSLLLFTHYRFP